MTNRLEHTWPLEAQAEIKRLRQENAKYRTERNSAREALVALTLEAGSMNRKCKNCGDRIEWGRVCSDCDGGGSVSSQYGDDTHADPAAESLGWSK